MCRILFLGCIYWNRFKCFNVLKTHYFSHVYSPSVCNVLMELVCLQAPQWAQCAQIGQLGDGDTSSCNKGTELEFQQGIPRRHLRQLRKSSFSGRPLLPLACALGFVTLQTVCMHRELYNSITDSNQVIFLGVIPPHLDSSFCKAGVCQNQSWHSWHFPMNSGWCYF